MHANTTRSQAASAKSIYSFNSSKSTFELGSLDKIDDDAYEKLKGTFFDLIVCQNGSRTLQKIIKSTHYCVLSKILDEVIMLYIIKFIDILSNTGFND